MTDGDERDVAKDAVKLAEMTSARNLRFFETAIKSGQLRNAMEIYCRGTEFIKLDLVKCRSIRDRDIYKKCDSEVIAIMIDFIKKTGDMLEESCST